MRRWLMIAWVAVTFAVTGQAQSGYRTPWGDPDLQGIWSNATVTPVERPAALAGRAFWTEAEAADIERNGFKEMVKRFGNPAEELVSGELNETWLEPGPVVRSRRTSLVADPPDGRIPYTAEAKARRDARATGARTPGGPEDRNNAERCITTQGFHLPNSLYNNNHQIFQSPGYVAILSEMLHEVRIIPLDGRPHLNGIRQWLGDSRGWWEGRTLVVETTNFNDKKQFQGATAALRLVERFTRVDTRTMDYEFTAIDPATYTQPWTVANTLRKTPGPLYEAACHEDNYSMAHTLSAARADEPGR